MRAIQQKLASYLSRYYSCSPVSCWVMWGKRGIVELMESKGACFALEELYRHFFLSLSSFSIQLLLLLRTTAWTHAVVRTAAALTQEAHNAITCTTSFFFLSSPFQLLFFVWNPISRSLSFYGQGT